MSYTVKNFSGRGYSLLDGDGVPIAQFTEKGQADKLCGLLNSGGDSEDLLELERYRKFGTLDDVAAKYAQLGEILKENGLRNPIGGIKAAGREVPAHRELNWKGKEINRFVGMIEYHLRHCLNRHGSFDYIIEQLNAPLKDKIERSIGFPNLSNLTVDWGTHPDGMFLVLSGEIDGKTFKKTLDPTSYLMVRLNERRMLTPTDDEE